MWLAFFGVTASLAGNRHERFKERKYFIFDLGYLGNILNETPNGVVIAFGYETLIIPDIDFIIVEAKIGYMNASAKKNNTNIVGSEVYDTDIYYFKTHGVRLSIAPKLDIPLNFDGSSSVYISNELGVYKSFSEVTFDDNTFMKDVNKSDPIRFYYDIKVGGKLNIGASNSISIWVGLTTISFQKTVADMVPENYNTNNIRLDWNIGTTLYF